MLSNFEPFFIMRDISCRDLYKIQLFSNFEYLVHPVWTSSKFFKENRKQSSEMAFYMDDLTDLKKTQT